MTIPTHPLKELRRIVAEGEQRLSVVGEVESEVEMGLVRGGDGSGTRGRLRQCCGPRLRGDYVRTLARECCWHLSSKNIYFRRLL